MKKCITDKNYDGVFLNPGGLPDGNMYGIVLNTLGVVIGPFKESRKSSDKNKKIILDQCGYKKYYFKGTRNTGFF